MISKIKRIIKKIFSYQKLEEQKIEIRNLKNEIIQLQIKIIEIEKTHAAKIKKSNFNFKQSEEAREGLIEMIRGLRKELIDERTKGSSQLNSNEEIQEEDDDDKKGSGKIKVKNTASKLLDVKEKLKK